MYYVKMGKVWNENKRSGSDHDLAHILDDRDLIWLIFLKTIGDRIWLIFQVIGPDRFQIIFRSFFITLQLLFDFYRLTIQGSQLDVLKKSGFLLASAKARVKENNYFPGKKFPVVLNLGF